VIDQPSALSSPFFFRHPIDPCRLCDPHAQPGLRIDCDEGTDGIYCTRDAILDVRLASRSPPPGFPRPLGGAKVRLDRTISNLPASIAGLSWNYDSSQERRVASKGKGARAFSTFKHRTCCSLFEIVRSNNFDRDNNEEAGKVRSCTKPASTVPT
jgi:hypothetical protein